jgi:hypothetical protein
MTTFFKNIPNHWPIRADVLLGYEFGLQRIRNLAIMRQ